MMYALLSILSILFTIFFIVGTHESAHFLTARLLGVKVIRFSIGFGKALCRWHDKSGTEYVLAMIPLGGYVKMLDENEGHVPKQELPLTFNRQPFYKKFLIIAAGPATNLLCAVVLYWLIFVIGFTAIKPVIGGTNPRSIAAENGIKANQEIIRIDNKPTLTWTSVMFKLLSHAGNQDHIKIEVNNLATNKIETHILDLSNWHINPLAPDLLTSLGIKPLEPTLQTQNQLQRHIQYTPLAAISHAVQEVMDFSYYNLLVLEKMLTGKLSPQSLGGPITIFESAGDALNSGFLSFISFLAFLSIAIGIINLLPIPGLDGGLLFIQIIEFIIRRPVPMYVLLFLYRLGFIFIFLIFFQAFVNDLLRLY